MDYFSYFCSKHRLCVLVRTASTKRLIRVPTIYVLSRSIKNIRIFYLKIFIFLVVKFSVYLNRHVFVVDLPRNFKMYVLWRNKKTYPSLVINYSSLASPMICHREYKFYIEIIYVKFRVVLFFFNYSSIYENI